MHLARMHSAWQGLQGDQDTAGKQACVQIWNWVVTGKEAKSPHSKISLMWNFPIDVSVEASTEMSPFYFYLNISLNLKSWIVQFSMGDFFSYTYSSIT